MTERVLNAMKCRELNILGHPSGRLIGKREAYHIDLERVMEEAARKGVMLELNGFPDRLDLNDLNCRKAKERGAILSLATDAHQLEHLDNMQLAVGTARRGWLEKGDCPEHPPAGRGPAAVRPFGKHLKYMSGHRLIERGE